MWFFDAWSQISQFRSNLPSLLPVFAKLIIRNLAYELWSCVHFLRREKAQEETPCYSRKWGGGRDYTQKKVLSGEAQPHGLTPYPFIPPFLTERYPFVYLSLTNGTPLTYLPSLELCIPFKCCKYTVFEIWINHQTRTFSGLLHSY